MTKIKILLALLNSPILNSPGCNFSFLLETKAIHNLSLYFLIAGFKNPNLNISNKFDKENVFVGEIEKEIVGWITLSKVSSRCCYEGVGEVSIYLHPMHQRNGFATLLYNHLEKNASSSGYWTIQAQLFTENTASKSLFESLQFRQVGIREKIGKYKDKWVDNYLYEKNIL